MKTQIFEAVKIGDLEAVSGYLSQGANVNMKNCKNESLLHVAVSQGNKEMVQYLIDAGIDLNIINKNGETAMQCCLLRFEKVDSEMIKMLVNAGCDVNSVSTSENTALHLACWKDDADLAQFLLERGADVRITDVLGNTPLHLAAGSFVNDSKLIEVLLMFRANINAQNILYATPVYSMFRNVMKNALSNEIFLKVFDIFLKYRADFNSKNYLGSTIMDEAVLCNAVFFVEKLIQHGGVDVNHQYNQSYVTPRKGQTILHEACRQKNLPLVKSLLKNGANINAVDNYNWTPLQYAIQHLQEKSELKLIHYLFEKEPNINLASYSGIHILNIMHIYPKFLWKTIIEYIAKQDSVGCIVHPKILETISEKRPYERYFNKCKEELEDLKKRKLCQSWVTFYDLLVDSKNILLIHVEKENIVNHLNSPGALNTFPIYGCKIKDRFSKAMKKQIVFIKCASILSACFNQHLDSTHLVIKKIFSYCDMKDLKTFSQLIS